jgi:NADPH:quinone reductase-like Zn-dependent oxidoreductase
VRATVIQDGKLVVQERSDPEPADGEVLVAVRAAGLNGADIMQAAGHYPPPPGVPQDIPGMELAGEVLALGPRTTRFAVGDRVMAIVGGGAQAERCVVSERRAPG